MQEAINTIRESSRSTLNINRRRLRDEEKDVHRSLSKLSISTEDVTKISLKLKTKSSITVQDLCNLKNALIDNEKNIEIVLKTNGSLRGLVRELSGHHERKQYEAAGCCCNLSLANSKGGVVVTKAAGPYLIAALSNLSTEMAVMCTWTLGNLAGSGINASTLLVAQGAMGKLIDKLSAPIKDLSDAAVEALIHFAYQLGDTLSVDHFEGIILNIQKLPVDLAALKLLFTLTCHKDFRIDLLNMDYLETILQVFFSILKASEEEENVEKLLYLVKTLANLYNSNVYGVILNFFVMSSSSSSRVQALLGHSRLGEPVLWLLGNMYSVCGSHHYFVNLFNLNMS